MKSDAQLDGLVPCVECGHDITWHESRDTERNWTDDEWAIEMEGTWNQGRCQWDTGYKGGECLCKAFKHPNAPKRREAIDHSRGLS